MVRGILSILNIHIVIIRIVGVHIFSHHLLLFDLHKPYVQKLGGVLYLLLVKLLIVQVPRLLGQLLEHLKVISFAGG